MRARGAPKMPGRARPRGRGLHRAPSEDRCIRQGARAAPLRRAPSRLTFPRCRKRRATARGSGHERLQLGIVAFELPSPILLASGPTSESFVPTSMGPSEVRLVSTDSRRHWASFPRSASAKATNATRPKPSIAPRARREASAARADSPGPSDSSQQTGTRAGNPFRPLPRPTGFLDPRRG